MTFGSLFAGIGGFDLGFERAGLRCEWQVEIDPYCQRVLAKHWPNVRRWDDVRTFPPAGEWGVDVICGGFPCQDISYAGKGAGLAGERSGLFYEVIRIVRQMGPRFIVLENVAALLDRGMGDVLGSLAAIGLRVEWHCIPAAAVGAPHIRDRVFILAHDDSYHGRASGVSEAEGRPANIAEPGSASSMANPDSSRRKTQRVREKRSRASNEVELRRGPISDAGRQLLEIRRERNRDGRRRTIVESLCSTGSDWWNTEPNVGRVANGVPARVDRLRGLGNAVVPQIAEWIGRRLMEATP